MNKKVKSLVVLLSLLISLPLLADNSKIADFPQDDLPKYGNDSVECVQNLSLYRESYKQWKQSKYKSPAISHAFTFWKKVITDCPKASENIYVDGVKMLNYYLKNAKDDVKKEKLIDSLMIVYDLRIKYFPLHYRTGKSQVGAILGRKGVDLYQDRPSAYKEVFEILSESIELDGAKAKGPVYVYYFRSITRMAVKGETDTAAVVDAYDMISDYIAANIKYYTEKGNMKKIQEYENIMGNIENTFEPFANCNDLVRIYQQKFDLAPDDVVLIKKIVKLLDKKKCVENSPLYFETTVRLYDLDPTPESAYLIGKMLLKQQRYGDAIKYMEDATNMEDLGKVDDAYIFLAEAYKAKNNFPKAREMAKEASKLNPTWGEPYLFVGDLYAMSAKECGDNDLTRKVAYWAAVDKYYKAKQVDSELTELANKRINTFKVYFPPTEVLFFYNLSEGDSYTVGCWINEVTTIRAAK